MRLLRLFPALALALLPGCSDVVGGDPDAPRPGRDLRPPDRAVDQTVSTEVLRDSGPVTATIGPSGGKLVSSDGKAELVIPAGALAKDTAFTIAIADLPLDADEVDSVASVGYDIGPTGYVFNGEVSLSISYTAADLGGAEEEDLVIGLAVGDEWEGLESSVLDAALKKVSAGLAHLSRYRLHRHCGNKRIQKRYREECDRDNFGGKTCASMGFDGGSLTCSRKRCKISTSGCTRCGNGTLDPGEDCEGTNLGGKTCASIGQGFSGGTLACTTTCKLDTSGCFKCGDGALNPGEDCDGANLGGKTCVSIAQGFNGGSLACTSACKLDTSSCTRCGDGVVNPGEDCDGASLGGKTCVSIGQGFDGGTLACNASCKLDTSACFSFSCGDGSITAGEECDGTNLGGKSCASQLPGLGFDGGTLACSACKLDTSACYRCGDGKVGGPELCDGADLNNQTCKSQGFDGGILYCIGGCTFDTAGCYKCGDGKLSPGEICDGSLHGGTTCQTLGFSGGALLCKPDCTFDTGFCTNSVCGNNVVEPGEDCEFSITPPFDCGPGYPPLMCDSLTCKWLGVCERCGDGIINGYESESCDPPGLLEDCTTYCGTGSIYSGNVICETDCQRDPSQCPCGPN